MFNENSGLVNLWLGAVRDGRYTREQVPKLSNLQEVVYSILDAQIV